MIPILFGPNEGLTNGFTSNGIGRLSACSRCEVTESINEMFELEMDYHMSGPHFTDLRTGNIIGAVPFQNGSIQGFEIYKISKPINGIATVYARHVSYRLSDIPVNKFSYHGLKSLFTALPTIGYESCPFTFSTDETSTADYVTTLPRSIRETLIGSKESVLTMYGGEFQWDNYKVIHKKNRGSDKGAVVRYGKNITDLKQEENIEKTITGILPYYNSNEIYKILDAPRQSANADKFPYHKTAIMDCTSDFENPPSLAALAWWAETYMQKNKIGVPVISMTVSFVDLKNTYEYMGVPMPSINLGDTVTVIFEKLGISEKSHVNKTVWNVLTDSYESIDIGERKETLTDELEKTSVLAGAAMTDAKMNYALDKATGTLNSGLRGHVVMNRNSDGWANELLFLDNENVSEAKSILRINMAGIGFSSTGYNGNFYQSWTLDGKMSLGGVNNGYGDLWLLSSQAVPMVELDNEGLKLWNITDAGYLANGAMYKDGDHTQAIEPREGSYYVDHTERKVYKYEGGYRETQDHEGIMAQMVHKGFGLYEGDIDLKWNGQTGIYFKASEQEGTSDELRIGDFMVVSEDGYGRQIWESSDECTGMSGEPAEWGQYYLWAGYYSESGEEEEHEYETDCYTFCVENQGGWGDDYVKVRGHFLVNGIDLLDFYNQLEARVTALENAHDDDDDGGDGPPGGTSGESGGTGPGYQN